MLGFLGDSVPGPGDIYEAFPGRTVNRRSVKENNQLKFLRTASHDAAIQRLREAAMYPVHIPKTPSTQPWNNFAQVLYTYFIHYCAAEGLTMSHHVTRPVRKQHTYLRTHFTRTCSFKNLYVLVFFQVLLYLFHGHFLVKATGRCYPVIRSIHLQTTNGRRRFATCADECFEKLFKLLENQPNLSKLLTDNKLEAPAEYLAAVEEGLRAMADKSVHTMGGGAMRSQEKWGKVLQWRKRER